MGPGHDGEMLGVTARRTRYCRVAK